MDSFANKEYSLEELMPLIQEQMRLGQSVRFSPRGTSMLPMLRQGIDYVVLSPLPEKLEKYDLPLYRRDNGQYVLHRIVACEGASYACMGDNQFQKEKGIRQDQMIAVVTAFYRTDKRHSVTERKYRLYCRVWYGTRYLRQLVRRVKGLLRRLIK